MEGII